MVHRSVLVLLLLAGCAGAGTWSKPAGTAEALQADQAACDQQAQQDFPPTLGNPPGAGLAAPPPTMSCVPNRGCVTTGGGYLAAPGAYDVNAAARAQDAEDCMRKRGWSR